ncbi:beta-ketoacyl-[acyl-carrier-protein] synthase family protein [Niveibacterium sp. SC-1]|uniref:beta-ketoacyl-[acyl-carrier-protein] synthase family protein n=1 Tax=Niveibacterium sp. SC-1 TaxID=3135646 RepID=UPI00311ED9FE
MAYLNQLGLLCALGNSPDEVATNLARGESPGMRKRPGYLAGREVVVGEVLATLPDISAVRRPLRSRNNALALAALTQIRPAVDAALARYGASRMAVILGTSTSGIAEGEAAMRHRVAAGEFPAGFDYGQQELGSLAQFVAETLGVSGPAYVISTACSSSARALMSAARLLRAGVVDAVLCGGVDTLCAFTVSGFAALESVSAEACNPLSANRCGINIGEGAALFLMTREPSAVRLAGWGESSDAHHMSAPDPSGRGAEIAIREALARAGLTPAEIDYINLHGTATRHNDAMESAVVARIFGEHTPVSSTKPLTGHTLGAAGAVEAALAWLMLQPGNAAGWLPAQRWDGQYDPQLPPLDVVGMNRQLGHAPRHVLSNSFAFGGSNAALILGAC